MSKEVQFKVTEKNTEQLLLEQYYSVPRDGENLTAKAKAGVQVTLSRNYQSLRIEVGGELPVEASSAAIQGGQRLLLKLCDEILDEHSNWIVETLSNLSGK